MTIKERYAINSTIKYLREQMYGNVPTSWTYGDEHDFMDNALSLLENLISIDLNEREWKRENKQEKL